MRTFNLTPLSTTAVSLCKLRASARAQGSLVAGMLSSPRKSSSGTPVSYYLLCRPIVYSSMVLDTADGQDRVRVSDGDVTREIAEKWKAMSKREQVAATDDALAELQERRENHQRGTHVVPIQAFHDTKTTLASMQREVSQSCDLLPFSLILNLPTARGSVHSHRHGDPPDRRPFGHRRVQCAVFVRF